MAIKLLVQEFLKTKSLEELFIEHKVNAHVARHKMSLNYDQIEAKDSDLVAQQCRGLILRTSDGSPITKDKPLDTAILAFPFVRFFNLGQREAANVDFHDPNTIVQEKHDGSLTILYYDDVMGEWCVATRAAPNGDIALNGYNSTARMLFERAILLRTTKTFQEWTQRLDKTLTYMFELCTPMNQVVVRHKTYTLTLIGVRDRITGYEMLPSSQASKIGISPVGQFHFSNQDEMLEFVKGRDPREYEGLVVCQPEKGTFKRVKVKNAQYMVFSRLKDTISSPRNVMTLILEGKVDDAFQVMPDEVKELTLRVQEGLRLFLDKYRAQYLNLRMTQDTQSKRIPSDPKDRPRAHRKEFALMAKESGIWFEPAMAQYIGQCTDIQDFLEQKKQSSEAKTWTPAFLDWLREECEKANPV